MTIDPDTYRGRETFPADQPMDALKSDHQLVRQLFDHYLNTQDMKEKKDIAGQILMRLDLHMSVEENIFYPRVRDVDPALVDQCDADHQQAKPLMDQLRQMDEGDPQGDQVCRQLADAIGRHVEREEQQLFTKVRQANLDLASIGTDMQVFETTMLRAGGVPVQRPDMRP